MPYIETKTTVKMTEKQTDELTEKLGKAISLLRGKSEAWLMLGFQGGMKMAFRGKRDADVAIAEIKIYGKASPAEYDALTAAVCKIYGEVLGVASDHVYVKYEEVEHWGFDGSNF